MEEIGKKSELKKTGSNLFRALRLMINISLLIFTVIVIVQNARVITINFLWKEFEISLALLVFLTGSIGSVITLFSLLFRKN